MNDGGVAELGAQDSGPSQLGGRQRPGRAEVDIRQVAQFEEKERLPDGADEPRGVALVSEYPVTGRTLHAFILIHNRLPVFIERDCPHGADEVAVSTAYTFCFV